MLDADSAAEVTDETEAGPSTRLLTAKAVQEMFGGVSHMTLWRWINDADLGFPAPIFIQKRRFWREAELLDFIERQPRAFGK